MSGEDSDSSFDLIVDDYDSDEPKSGTKDSKRPGITQYKNYLNYSKQPIFSAELPFEEMNRALNIMRTPHRKNKIKFCNSIRDPREKFADLTNVHYCHLIKRAILKHEWYKIPKLLISFIDDVKHKNQNHVIIARYSMIYLFNDPVAKKNKLLTELLKTALSSKNEMEIKNFLKSCISSQHFSKNVLINPQNKSVNENN